ncbi:hypothetical protein [Xanthomonas campestris]|uniref:hypothetical protein n=1 Tax=Xanthomonas campestris TaxID=339 RepID=UPI001E5E3F9D|nr:hypothetical protein [Xanthomonas campestris]MCC5064152.1 hypothetical protein [Xanthomonas campestris pv. raphani]MEA9890060.1 hypothetical protein [Xanthomonas campestris pv. raphani]MEA9975248.1 hypothetical protein [Xanthomonas campestris pv. raphani]
MNPHFLSFIQLGKELAAAHGVAWEIPLDQSGTAIKGHEWDLTALAGGVAPKHRLRHFSSDRSALDALNAVRASSGQSPLPHRTLSTAWQDLIKAVVMDQLFVRRNSFGHVASNVARPLRVIATCAADIEPWNVTVDEMAVSVRTGNSIQASGKLGDLIAGLIKVLFDTNHLADAGPLYSALAAARLQSRTTRRSKFLNSTAEIRHNLEDRKRAERLPERRAFWELVRIVMTEQPLTFMDELRFAAIRIMILTGFRLGEATLLPAEWRTDRHYYDSSRRPAGELGGYSQSLMIRHFAEKQQAKNTNSNVLIDKTHYVPQMFEEIVSETLTRAAAITSPLRNTLRKQTETGRVLPDFACSELVPITQIYTRLTGNAFWLDMNERERQSWIQKCRQNYSAECFTDLQNAQEQISANSLGQMSAAARMYFRRMTATDGNGPSLALRNASGTAISFKGVRDLSNVFVKIGDLEDHLRIAGASKLPDTDLFSLTDRSFNSWEFIFLHPKRSLSEERNDGICDISRYVAVGRPDTTLVSQALGDQKGAVTLFERYGQTEADKSLVLTSHSLRHLQNTELFRLSVADTIISKRFNRRSVAQSYEYDHRSLAEELDQLELPAEIEMSLGEKASTVAKMIQSGKASGPIVETFKQIQSSEGDAAAFEFLKVEADGFHATPYGHCLNSFTVDPCPKHLECFSGCRHLSATNLPENRRHLQTLELKLVAAVETAEAKPSKSIGRTNQIQHAKVRLDGVRTLLATQQGEKPFPDGPDLSLPRDKGVMDG